MRWLTILGSTGSIGESTLDVVARHPGRFGVYALVARSSADSLFDQCMRHAPRLAVLADADAAHRLARRLREAGSATEVLAGEEGAVAAAQAAEADTVVAAIVGAAGLKPALAAARAGKRILLANKEALVMAGPVFLEAAAQGGATILPVDSEHNAIFQSLPAGFARGLAGHGVRRILLTASGGPFRTLPIERLAGVTPAQACAHPNWVMGRKISVDSATMMNKGLEVIEAHWLFGAAGDEIEVVIHPQSVIHSMVEYADGSVLAQLGNPDMRTPIAQTLAYPDRIEAGVAPFDIFKLAQFTFEAPDHARFPCLRLAYAALEAAGTHPATLNAANEVAVQAFLEGRLAFTGIAALVDRVMSALPARPLADLDAVLDADRDARRAALEYIR
ncbi:MAG: 1-deoxy-D-xylulose-5-phosphate reductoisomerase [Burkholderiales bacterium]|nr:1-deoxy-D-xylulose-5-phosphate reductoisomerase [Burkholderiales bacterium]